MPAKKKPAASKKPIPKKKVTKKVTKRVVKKIRPVIDATKPIKSAPKKTSPKPAVDTMKRFQSAASQWRWSRDAVEAGKKIGLVPTMGAFHEGHLSLIKKAVSQNDLTVVSIFVNPLQFGKGEDFSAYPRDLARDTDLAREMGVDAIFIPDPTDMYPAGYCTLVSAGPLAERLCGANRPGHFDGVCTVVTKLIGIVQPSRIYLGEKDAQQLYILQRMISDLDLFVKVVGCSTVREKDGLAMSSRNAYLSPEDRAEAIKLHEALRLVQKAILLENARDAADLKERMQSHIIAGGRFEIDYIAIVDPESLDDREVLTGRTLIAIAARIGGTRLIDNILINVPGGQLAAGLGNIRR
jgi:pantoate--beta-alanine ligase